jgi:hypothetical protein
MKETDGSVHHGKLFFAVRPAIKIGFDDFCGSQSGLGNAGD